MNTDRKFRHDCARCVFLGSVIVNVPFSPGRTTSTAFDLYKCPTSAIGEFSIIARHGDDGPEYASMPADLIRSSLIPAVEAHGRHSGYSEALIEGLRRLGA